MPPHLHFHVCDGKGPLGDRDEFLECNGLPYVLPSLELLGYARADDVASGIPWTPTVPPQVRAAELPLREAVVNLP
jgi:hypothetical protein